MQSISVPTKPPYTNAWYSNYYKYWQIDKFLLVLSCF